MRRIATSLCAAGMLLGLVGPASAGAFGPTGSFDGSGSGSGQFSHPEGAVVTGSTGSGPGQLAQPQGLTSDGASVYVADPGNGRILKFDAAGNVQGQWAMPTYTIVANGTTITGRIEPHDVAVDGSGRVFAPDA